MQSAERDQSSTGSAIAAGVRRNRQIFYCWALPILWFPAAMVSWNHPGDEFLLFILVNGLPGAWLPLILGPIKLTEQLPLLFGTGILTLVATGCLMDWLRVGRRLWGLLCAAGFPAIALLILSGHPSYSAALAKNGSLVAYFSAAFNFNLYLASAVMVVGNLLARLVRRLRSRPIASDLGRLAGR